jgi:hypothetical protein
MGMIKLSEADRSEQSNFLLSCSLSSAIILLERGYSHFLAREPKQKGFSFSSFALNFDRNFLKLLFFSSSRISTVCRWEIYPNELGLCLLKTSRLSTVTVLRKPVHFTGWKEKVKFLF